MYFGCKNSTCWAHAAPSMLTWLRMRPPWHTAFLVVPPRATHNRHTLESRLLIAITGRLTARRLPTRTVEPSNLYTPCKYACLPTAFNLPGGGQHHQFGRVGEGFLGNGVHVLAGLAVGDRGPAYGDKVLGGGECAPGWFEGQGRKSWLHELEAAVRQGNTDASSHSAGASNGRTHLHSQLVAAGWATCVAVGLCDLGLGFGRQSGHPEGLF